MFKKGIVLFVGLLFILLVAGCEKAGEVSLQQIQQIPQKLELPKGLVAYYPFEGDLKDANGLLGEGKVIGPKIGQPGGNVSFADGVVEKALVLDGNSGVLLYEGPVETYEYSIALWIYPEALTYYTPAFFAAINTDTWISIVPGGHSLFEGRAGFWSGSAWFDGWTDMKLETNKWYHFAVTVDNGLVSVYINGEKRFEGKRVQDLFRGEKAIFVLGVNWWDPPFKGKIDELRIYNKVLTADEVKELASAK
jgi:arabinan endo-1,5-alpha-L-arabinosidase